VRSLNQRQQPIRLILSHNVLLYTKHREKVTPLNIRLRSAAYIIIVGYEGQVARGDALGGRWKV
jgi:hypothetical protein